MKLNYILILTLFLSTTHFNSYALNFSKGSFPAKNIIGDLDDAMKIMRSLYSPNKICRFWFKGIGAPKRGLHPSVFYQPYKEKAMIKRSNMYAEILRLADEPHIFDTMAYLQYSDMPSTLIDWEENFLNALFDSVILAEDEEDEMYEKDLKKNTKFFILNPYKLNKISQVSKNQKFKIYHSDDIEVNIRALTARYNNQTNLEQVFKKLILTSDQKKFGENFKKQISKKNIKKLAQSFTQIKPINNQIYLEQICKQLISLSNQIDLIQIFTQIKPTNNQIDLSQILKQLRPISNQIDLAQNFKQLTSLSNQINLSQILAQLISASYQIYLAQIFIQLILLSNQIDIAQKLTELKPTRDQTALAQNLEKLRPTNNQIDIAQTLAQLKPIRDQITIAQILEQLRPTNDQIYLAQTLAQPKAITDQKTIDQTFKQLISTNDQMYIDQLLKQLKPIKNREISRILSYYKINLPIAVSPKKYAAPFQKHTHNFTLHGGFLSEHNKTFRPVSLERLNDLQNDENKFLQVYKVKNRLKIKRQLAAIGIHSGSVAASFDLWDDEVLRRNNVDRRDPRF